MLNYAVSIPLSDCVLTGILIVPDDPIGLTIFVHGSGSSQYSPRNQFVARVLHGRRIGTLLFDLLTPREEKIDDVTRHLRFDIDLLAKRLWETTDWVSTAKATSHLPISYFGASTGAAAALIAATKTSSDIKSIVSRGGRPDLAGAALKQVHSPTLLIVGELDTAVIDLNVRAQRNMTNAICRLEIVPDATHLFEESGTLHAAAELAAAWFEAYFIGEDSAHHGGNLEVQVVPSASSADRNSGLGQIST